MCKLLFLYFFTLSLWGELSLELQTEKQDLIHSLTSIPKNALSPQLSEGQDILLVRAYSIQTQRDIDHLKYDILYFTQRVKEYADVEDQKSALLSQINSLRSLTVYWFNFYVSQVQAITAKCSQKEFSMLCQLHQNPDNNHLYLQLQSLHARYHIWQLLKEQTKKRLILLTKTQNSLLLATSISQLQRVFKQLEERQKEFEFPHISPQILTYMKQEVTKKLQRELRMDQVTLGTLRLQNEYFSRLEIKISQMKALIGKLGQEMSTKQFLWCLQESESIEEWFIISQMRNKKT